MWPRVVSSMHTNVNRITWHTLPYPTAPSHTPHAIPHTTALQNHVSLHPVPLHLQICDFIDGWQAVVVKPLTRPKSQRWLVESPQSWLILVVTHFLISEHRHFCLALRLCVKLGRLRFFFQKKTWVNSRTVFWFFGFNDSVENSIRVNLQSDSYMEGHWFGSQSLRCPIFRRYLWGND